MQIKRDAYMELMNWLFRTVDQNKKQAYRLRPAHFAFYQALEEEHSHGQTALMAIKAGKAVEPGRGSKQQRAVHAYNPRPPQLGLWSEGRGPLTDKPAGRSGASEVSMI